MQQRGREIVDQFSHLKKDQIMEIQYLKEYPVANGLESKYADQRKEHKYI